MDATTNKVIMQALLKQYPRAVERLKAEWSDLRYTTMVDGLSETEYILNKLPAALDQQRMTFVDWDKRHRMSMTAEKFKIRANPELWQKHYPTGFERLDDALGGGFTPGVHYIGAISSLGKSTFVLQMVDHMVSNDVPVVYVSLEMSEEDLTAKLISMHTFLSTGKSERFAKTSTILRSESSKYFDDEEWGVVYRAADKVATHGTEVTVLENLHSVMTVDNITKYIAQYVDAYKIRPVLVVDYLQILVAPKTMRGCSDKQVVDYNVAQFRAIAAQYNIPVIVISSFNRDNYSAKASLQAFKDSGNIEYSSDTLLGLQLHGVGEEDFDVDEAKAAYPRQIDLVILKQRYGPSNYTILYDYYTKYSYFDEQDWITLPDSTRTPFSEGEQCTMEGLQGRKKRIIEA